MRVPISSKQNFTIKRVIKLPTKVANFMLWMRFEWNFVAIDTENNFIIFKDLNSCIEKSKKILVCENQSEIVNDHIRNCISNMIQLNIVGLELCADYILFARLPNTVLVENNVGEFWFNSNQLQRLEFICDGTNTNETITGNVVITSNKQYTLFINEMNLTVKIKPSNDFDDINTMSTFYDQNITSVFTDDFPSSTLSNNIVYDIESFTKIGRTLKNCLVLHRFQNIVKDLESFRRTFPICS